MRRDRPRGSLTEASHSRERLVPLSENLGSQDGHFLPSSKPSSGKPIVLPDSHVSYHDLINGSRTLWSPSLYVTYFVCPPAQAWSLGQHREEVPVTSTIRGRSSPMAEAKAGTLVRTVAASTGPSFMGKVSKRSAHRSSSRAQPLTSTPEMSELSQPRPDSFTPAAFCFAGWVVVIHNRGVD